MSTQRVTSNAVPAPPLPTLSPPLAARPCAAHGADLDRVHGWMNAPHVARRWDQAWSLTRWADALRGQLAGSYSRPLVVSHEGVAFAYVELYRAAQHPIAEQYAADPFDVGFHLAIGSREHEGRGLGREVLRGVADAVFAIEPACRRVVAEPDVANAAVARMNEAAGMHFVRELVLPHKRAALFVLPRTPADLAV